MQVIQHVQLVYDQQFFGFRGGGNCIQAGAFGVQLARSGFGVKICFRVFRQMVFRRQKCYISSI